MVWLQTPPWGRWLLSALIAAVAIWVEMGPEPSVSHPFAVADIAAGSVVDASNTEERTLAAGLLEPVELGGTTRAPIPAGDPVLASDLGEESSMVPDGWWVIEVALPRGAAVGDDARVVLLDSGDVVEAKVVGSTDEDPLGSGLGMVAVEPERATAAVMAAAEGKVAIMIASD